IAGRPGTGQGAPHPAEQPHRAAGTAHRRGGKGGGGRNGTGGEPHPGAAGCPAAAECPHHPESRRADGRRGQHERGGTVRKILNKLTCMAVSLTFLMGCMATPAFAYGGEETTTPSIFETEEEPVIVVEQDAGPLTPEGNLTV